MEPLKSISIAQRLFDIACQRNRIIERILELEYSKRIELYLFNSMYCLMYLDEHKAHLDNSDFNVLLLITTWRLTEQYNLGYSKEDAFKLAQNRYKLYSHELKTVFSHQAMGKRYYPKLFYNRICLAPLTFQDISMLNYRDEMWNEPELCDLFALQINSLNQDIDKYF